ncbi:MAG: hypothetical protein FOGNACKC_02896 [Anaerolineae bacterium]|nr:hypothetical protein [Anaerolineae bacterium]
MQRASSEPLTPETISQSLTELFHLVRSLIPEDQNLVTVSPNTEVSTAVALMQKYNFSQLPVVAGDDVLGVFSYRSLANRLLAIGKTKEHFGDLSVDEFMEQFKFAQPSDNWESILDYLNHASGVFVGNRDQLEGIVTATDVLKYLHHIASPFVMLAEIELSLRRIIQRCVTDTELQGCMQNSLKDIYSQDEMPTGVLEMTFNDYAQIIGDGRNWPKFCIVFGNSEWYRKKTAENLKEVRDLRNDVFHFRRSLTKEDYEKLAIHRNWLQIKTRAFESLKRKKQIKVMKVIDEQPVKQEWDESSLLTELMDKGRGDEANIVTKILNWAKARNLMVQWGEKQKYGKFNALIKHNNVICYLITVSMGQGSTYVQLQFGKMLQQPPFDDQAKRLEFRKQLNNIEGIDLPIEAIDSYPGIFLTKLRDKLVLDQFLNTLDWAVQETQSVQS